jgi:hypothetical protein
MSNFSENEVAQMQAGGNDVAREMYLANYNFEKYGLPNPGDEGSILKFMTSVFLKQSFRPGKEASRPAAVQPQGGNTKPQQQRQTNPHDDVDDWDPFTGETLSSPNSKQQPQQRQPNPPQQLKPGNVQQMPPQQPVQKPQPQQQQAAQQPVQQPKAVDLLGGLSFTQPQTQVQAQASLSLDQQRLLLQQQQQELMLRQQQLLIAQQQQALAQQMGQFSMQQPTGYPMQFAGQQQQMAPVQYQQQMMFNPMQPQQHQQHHQQPHQQPPQQNKASNDQFAGLLSNFMNDKDFDNAQTTPQQGTTNLF